MEISLNVLLLIVGAAIVTFIPRVLPLLVLSKVNIPEWGMKWLSYIPISIMAALLAHSLFMHESFQVDYILAAIPTFLVAIYTRSLLGAVMTGVIAVIIIRMFL
ncbi:AzlD domain-containing protein [Bacillus manliponensis]|uniref:AzlD domain-containing protein n=1 Tax=Bacillus manliponensis TaxID=574376 RepID=UPI003512B004